MRGRRTRWRRVLLGALVVLIAALIVLRIALPTIVERSVNRALDQHPDYDGQIGDVDLALIRGAYSIHDIEILKETGQVTEPLYAADQVDISLLWSALWRGALAGEITMYHPRLSFVNGDDPDEDQTGAESPEDWRDTVLELSPVRIDRLVIRDGEIDYVDRTAEPPIRVDLSGLEAEARNLTNSEKLSGTLLATITATGKDETFGELSMDAKLDPYADQPTFDLDLRLAGVKLVEFNPLLERHLKLDLESGTMDVNLEIAAKEGRFNGYVKPVTHDVQVVRIEEFRQDREDPLRAAWEVVAGAAKGVLTNPRKEQLATRVPIEGTFDDPQVGVIPALGSAVYNAFVEALSNSLENSINLSDATSG